MKSRRRVRYTLHMFAPNQAGDGKHDRRALCGLVGHRLDRIATVDDATLVLAENVDHRPRCEGCRAKLREQAAAEAVRRANIAPAVHAERQLPISSELRRMIERSRRGEVDERTPWGGLDALLDHVLPVLADGRAIRSSSDTDRFGVMPQTSKRSSDPANGWDNVINFELALSRVTSCIADAADRGELLGGVEWSRSHLAALVLHRSDLEALALAVGRTPRQTQRARALVRGALVAELARIGLVPRPRGMVEATHAGVRVLERVRAERTKEHVMAAPEGWSCDGWKEIGRVIGRSEDVCQRLAQREDDPLPVDRFLGRPIAKREELLAWVRREVDRARAA
jgi:hypothetical protein